jgi:ribonuclease P protein component
MSLFSFRKGEILRKKKLIDRLFNEGASFFIYPLKTFWLNVPPDSATPAQVLFSVSKKSFPLASDRNRIKRQLREAYRQNKHHLYDHLEKQHQHCILAVIYAANAHLPSDDLEIKIKAVMKRLFLELNKKLNNPPLSLSVDKTELI